LASPIRARSPARVPDGDGDPMVTARCSSTRTASPRRLGRRMAKDDPGWSRRRIAMELAKLGFRVDKNTVAKYMPKSRRRRRPPSQTWKTFVRNHLAGSQSSQSATSAHAPTSLDVSSLAIGRSSDVHRWPVLGVHRGSRWDGLRQPLSRVRQTNSETT
jgi:hypothetical protein